MPNKCMRACTCINTLHTYMHMHTHTHTIFTNDCHFVTALLGFLAIFHAVTTIWFYKNLNVHNGPLE